LLILHCNVTHEERPAEKSAFLFALLSLRIVSQIRRTHSSGIQQTKAAEPPKFRNNSNLLSLSARAMTQMTT